MTDAPDTAAPSLGLFQRFMGIIFSPGPTMAAALRKPSPFGILFLSALVIAVSTAGPQMTESIQQATLDMQVTQQEQFTGQPVSDEAYERMQAMAPYTPLFTVGGTFIMMPVMVLIFTAIFWALFNAVFGGTASFKEVLTVVCHGMVIVAVGAVLAAPVVLMQGQMTTSGPFNLGALLPMLPEGSFLSRLMAGINVFGIWQTIVVGIGLSVLYKKQSSSVIIGLLIAYVLMVAAFASVFGAFMGG